MDHLLVSTSRLFNAVKSIKGIELLKAPDSLILQTSQEVNEEWSNGWDEDFGFGSSDTTYLIKDVVDTIIRTLYGYSNRKYTTDFNPSLCVVEIKGE